MKNYATQTGKLIWKNIYGSPLGIFQGPLKSAMNNNPDLASTWKGRILMNIEMIHPNEMKNMPIEKSINKIDASFRSVQAVKEAMEMKRFQIIAEVGQGIYLPEKSTKYTVRIQIGDFFIDTDKPKSHGNKYNRWHQRFEFKEVLMPYRSIEEIETVFIYLMDADKPICFWKGPAS